jgi:hypothetical protein
MRRAARRSSQGAACASWKPPDGRQHVAERTAPVRRDAADERDRGDALRQAARAGERMRPAAGDADHREAVPAEAVGGPVEQRPARLGRRAAIPGRSTVARSMSSAAGSAGSGGRNSRDPRARSCCCLDQALVSMRRLTGMLGA